jgi:hypothetical protein
MNLSDLYNLISCVGKTETELTNWLNPSQFIREEIYEGSDWYFVKIEAGLSLLFELPQQRLKKLSLVLVPLLDKEARYSEELPYGISELESRQRIREHWGEPASSVIPQKHWGLASNGGYDIYSINAHPDKKLIIGYTADFEIQSVHVELR